MKIKDRIAIQELISKQYYAVDNDDLEKFRTYYTENIQVEVTVGSNPVRLTKSLDKVVEQLSARRKILNEKGIQTRHYSSNISMNEISTGMVQVSLMILITWQRDSEPKPEVVHTGFTVFEIIKVDDKWKINKRKTKIDHTHWE